MYRDVTQWQHIRHRIQEDGTPKKQLSRETGIGRRTINKMLSHERPAGYGPRAPFYPKLGPYIAAIDQLLDAAAQTPMVKWTIQSIVEHLRLSEGFAGSYDSVRRYIGRRAHDGQSAWERAYDLIRKLPKPRAIDFIQLLSRNERPLFASVRFELLCGRPHLLADPETDLAANSSGKPIPSGCGRYCRKRLMMGPLVASSATCQTSASCSKPFATAP
jgi:hypothetical protein